MPMMKESDFKKHMSSKQFSNLYFIDGDEKMLVSLHTEALIKKLMGDNPPEFNYHTFSGDVDISALSVSCDVVPFMSDKNCVKVSDLDIDSLAQSDVDALFDICKNIPDTTVLIFTMPTLMPASKPLKKYKKIRDYIEKNGTVAELNKRTEVSLEKTVCKWANECGSKISPVVAARLISYCGNDLRVLHNEVSKLSAFSDGEEITVEMIDMLVAKNLQARIFDLFDCVIAQDNNKAMHIIDVLFYQREEAVTILITLANAYVDMYRARIAVESGLPTKIMADELSYKGRAWVLDKMARQSKRISTVALRDSIDAILELNERLVSVSVNPRIEIEKLISKLVLIARGDYYGK